MTNKTTKTTKKATPKSNAKVGNGDSNRVHKGRDDTITEEKIKSPMEKRGSSFFETIKYELLSWWYGDQARSEVTIRLVNKKNGEDDEKVSLTLEVESTIGAVYGGNRQLRKILHISNAYLAQNIPLLIHSLCAHLDENEELKKDGHVRSEADLFSKKIKESKKKGNK